MLYNILREMKYLFIIIILFNILCAKSALYYVDIYSAKYKIDARVVKALIEKESQGKVNAISRKNAIGLMQVMLGTARGYYLERYKKDGYKWGLIWYKSPDVILSKHIKLSYINIKIGCWYLKKCLDYYKGNYLLALNAYIQGIQGAKENESWEYINSIIDKIIKFE